MCSFQGTFARGLSLACYVYIIQHCTRDVNRTLVLFIVRLVRALVGVGRRALVGVGRRRRALVGVGGRWWALACVGGRRRA